MACFCAGKKADDGVFLAMLPFSLKHCWLALGAAIVFCAPVGAHAQSMTEYDSRSAVIFTYFAVGNDDNPSASVTVEQFTQQIEELSSDGYVVKPLPEIVDAWRTGKTLPPRTVALTFDGADKSIIQTAFPLLNEHGIPFTVFIPAEKIGHGATMEWSDLRRLKKNPLVSFGVHPAAYNRLADDGAGEIKRQINNSIASIRKQLGIDVALFAYPFGEYDSAYKKIVRDLGMKAAFGQQSGVAYGGDDLFGLPRFTQTERYGDLERFQMTANALPFPVRDISPENPHLNTLSPAIGFTVPDTLAKSLKGLSCFSSSEEKPKLEIMNARVELRMENPFAEDRPRINCTLPVTVDGDTRWRWFGALYTIPSALLQAEQMRQEKTPTAHAAGASNEVSVE